MGGCAAGMSWPEPGATILGKTFLWGRLGYDFSSNTNLIEPAGPQAVGRQARPSYVHGLGASPRGCLVIVCPVSGHHRTIFHVFPIGEEARPSGRRSS